MNLLDINPFPAEWVLRALIDFTLSNARRFYSSMGNPLDGKGLSESLYFTPHCKSKFMETSTLVEKTNKQKKKTGWSSTTLIGLWTAAYSQMQSHYCVTRELYLLCFHPGPIHSSLINLESSDSSILPMLTPKLARTPDLYKTTAPRGPDLKPSKHPSLFEPRLQACATTPGWQTVWTI